MKSKLFIAIWPLFMLMSLKSAPFMAQAEIDTGHDLQAYSNRTTPVESDLIPISYTTRKGEGN